MGYWKNEMERFQELRGIAMHLLVQTGAVRECDDHDGVFIDRQDEEAVQEAQKIGSNMVEQGKVNATHAEFQDAIKNAIESAGSNATRAPKIGIHSDAAALKASVGPVDFGWQRCGL